MKNKNNRQDYHKKSHNIIPFQAFLKIHYGKNGKHNKRNNFLDGFKLRSGKLVMPYAVCRHLEAIFNKRYKPAYEYRNP